MTDLFLPFSVVLELLPEYNVDNEDGVNTYVSENPGVFLNEPLHGDGDECCT